MILQASAVSYSGCEGRLAVRRSAGRNVWQRQNRRSRIVPARCSSQLDQQPSASAALTDAANRVSAAASSTPAAVADAANRLSASAGHTIRDLVASTSAAVEQPLSFSRVVTEQADALAAQLEKQIDSITSRAIQLASSNPVTDGLDRMSSSLSEGFASAAPHPVNGGQIQPHYGTQAAVGAAQEVTRLATEQLRSLTGQQTLQLPPLPPVKQAVGAAYAEATGAIANAIANVTSPVNKLSSSITSQLTAVGPGQPLEPHYGTQAVKAAAAQLSGWFTSQSGILRPASLPSLPGLHTAMDSLQQGIKGLQSQGSQLTAPDFLLQASAALDGLKTYLSQLSQNIPAGLSAPASDFSSAQAALAAGLIGPGASFATSFSSLQDQDFGGYSPTTIGLLSIVIAAAVAASVPAKGYGQPDPADTLPWDWSADNVASYWSRRPVAVARRSVTVTMAALSVGLALLLDRARGKLATNSPGRAIQVRKAIERLGPAYVKVAQAISTRVDVLDYSYLVEIERLQDRVPPFPTEDALKVMATAFEQPVKEVFSSLSPAPVASASLGQVYRGRLREGYGGGEVAVKVQRPSVLASVSLDLLLMRRFATFCQTFPQVRTNWVGLIDEWATRFFHELDYEREAQNGMTFKEQMAHLDGIVVADVYQQLSNKEVLTTVWVQGEKLSESTASDVRELCTTLLNCYLIQLLETGFLHADPHPGNLIRTPEGQICILDFGLMTEVTPEQSLALVEYIAHLSVSDWNGIARDLRALGFVPPDAPEMAELGLIEPLGNILSQLSKGGGAKGINIDAVTVALEELSKDYPIDIPPYFALILRAFSVIEGTALRVDPDYAIVKETFPYLSRRLLTDDQPRTRAALKQLLYGDKPRLDIGRLQRLSSGFGSFTTSGIKATEPAAATPVLDNNAKEVLKLVFNQRGSYLQELLVDELVAGADAVGREAVSEVCRAVLGTAPALATFGTLQALGPLRLLLAPFPTPFELLTSLQPAVQPNEEDQQALLTVKGIYDIVQPGFSQDRDDVQRRQLWNELWSLLPEILPGLGLTAEMFARQLLARIALRLSEELQKPPRRVDSLGAQPQYKYTNALEGVTSTPFWFLVPPPLLLLGELAKQSSRSGGQHGRKMGTRQ